MEGLFLKIVSINFRRMTRRVIPPCNSWNADGGRKSRREAVNEGASDGNILLISTAVSTVEMTRGNRNRARCSIVLLEEFCPVILEPFSCRERRRFRAALDAVATALAARKISFFGREGEAELAGGAGGCEICLRADPEILRNGWPLVRVRLALIGNLLARPQPTPRRTLLLAPALLRALTVLQSFPASVRARRKMRRRVDSASNASARVIRVPTPSESNPFDL